MSWYKALILIISKTYCNMSENINDGEVFSYCNLLDQKFFL